VRSFRKLPIEGGIFLKKFNLKLFNHLCAQLLNQSGKKVISKKIEKGSVSPCRNGIASKD
jgi:hypothetical protein